MERLALILKALAEGKTVVFSTYTRAIEVSPKTYAKWQKAGNQLFRAEGDHLWMASGRNWTCMDYCLITFHP